MGCNSTLLFCQSPLPCQTSVSECSCRMEGLRIRLSIRLIGRLSSSPSKMASTKHATVPIANWRIPSRDADSPTLKQPMLLEGSVEEDGVNGGGRRMHWRWWSRDHNYLRRMVLVGMAWPFLTTSLVCFSQFYVFRGGLTIPGEGTAINKLHERIK